MDSFAQTPAGILMIANGLDPLQKWDGFSFQLEPVGVPAPTTALTMTDSGSGAIVGTYYAYTRFVDGDGNVSDLSPISASLDAEGTTGTITDATNATPVVITSASHGLTTGTTVKITGIGGNTGANDTWIITVVDGNTFELDDSAGTNDYTGGGTWVSGVSTINYASVPTTTNPKIASKQILRNTDGQADTFYVDVDTTDLANTSFTSTRTDTQLTTQTSQAILDSEGLPLANRHGIAPNWKACIVSHQDRMFLAGEVVYSLGGCKVTFGSTTVTGVGTSWTASLAGRYLNVVGARRSYLISSVNTLLQTLTLSLVYSGTTDNFAAYAIRPAPAERKLIYYSEAGLPESWPAINAVTIQDDNDEIVGLMPKGSFLYILERRHVYRMTFGDDPAKDGAVFLAAKRGVVNNRCWVLVDDIAYMLDEQGIHAFGEGQETESVSNPIQEIFRPNSRAAYQINWRAREFFHGVHYQPQEVIRWFVCLSGEWQPRHAVAFNYRLNRWWLEEYASPITASVAGKRLSVPGVYLGSTARKVHAFWEGFLDGPNPDLGTVRGTVTGAGARTITDSAAVFASSGLVGSPVVISYGLGKGQRRIVTAVSGTTITVSQPWLVQPDTTSVYQLGGIPWRYVTGWFRFAGAEEFQDRGLEIVFEKVATPGTMDTRIRYDYTTTPNAWLNAMPLAAGDGVEVKVGDTDFVVDLESSKGRVTKRVPGHKENWFQGGKMFTQVELAGVSVNDQVAIYSLTYLGVAGKGGG